MIYYCIPITKSFDLQFQEEVLPLSAKGWGEKRRQEFLASRKALISALRLYGEKVDGAPSIVDHLYVKEYPNYLVSLSHESDLAVAFLSRRDEDDFSSIGIDIEKIDRAINPETRRFFLHPKDDQQLSLLQLWVAKEAAYKALYPLRHELTDDGAPHLVLKDIWIKNSLFGYREQKGTLGVVELSTLSGVNGLHLLGKALIPLYSDSYSHSYSH